MLRSAVLRCGPPSAPPSSNFALPGNPKPGSCLFSLTSTSTSPALPPGRLISLHSPPSRHPAAGGTAAILTTVAPNSRLVRWLSAGVSEKHRACLTNRPPVLRDRTLPRDEKRPLRQSAESLPPHGSSATRSKQRLGAAGELLP